MSTSKSSYVRSKKVLSSDKSPRKTTLNTLPKNSQPPLQEWHIDVDSTAETYTLHLGNSYELVATVIHDPQSSQNWTSMANSSGKKYTIRIPSFDFILSTIQVAKPLRGQNYGEQMMNIIFNYLKQQYAPPVTIILHAEDNSLEHRLVKWYLKNGFTTDKYILDHLSDHTINMMGLPMWKTL